MHRGTALSICYLLAGNRDGFLATTTTAVVDGDHGKQRHGDRLPLEGEEEEKWDEVLTEPQYYYHVRGDDTGGGDGGNGRVEDGPYPVCPSFAKWRFPHGRVPGMWARAFVSYCFFFLPSLCFVFVVVV